MITTRVGFWTATSLGILGVAYAIVVAVGVSQAGSDSPIVDPVLAVMEVLTLLSAPLIVTLMATIHTHGPPETKVFTASALAFGVAMATLTSAVHFIALTVARATGSFVLEWPSAMYAAELLAWDVFLGLALVLSSSAFKGGNLNRTVRWALAVTGALCLLGTIGPLINDMRVQRIGMLGYGVGLPICCFLVARVFSRAGERERG